MVFTIYCKVERQFCELDVGELIYIKQLAKIRNKVNAFLNILNTETKY
jgi:hypothetical protein